MNHGVMSKGQRRHCVLEGAPAGQIRDTRSMKIMLEMDYKIRIHELLLIQINRRRGTAFPYNRKPTNKCRRNDRNRKSPFGNSHRGG